MDPIYQRPGLNKLPGRPSDDIAAASGEGGDDDDNRSNAAVSFRAARLAKIAESGIHFQTAPNTLNPLDPTTPRITPRF